jgi:predicted RNA methylase
VATTITIRHNHQDGTLVYGSTKGDGVYELIGPRTAARFRWFPSIRQMGIQQSRDHLAQRWRIDAAAEALRAAGFEVTVEIDDTPRDMAEVKADRAERLDARYDRLTTRAQREAAEAQARFARADQIAERFAGGQPILVGHHSERGARADQKRIDQNERAGHRAARKAEYAAAAAAVVGNADAYRERPGVIIRRIDKTEAELRQTMHHINGTRPANDWRGAYYAPERKPATGAWLEQLQARKTFLEHQLAADREALAEHERNGYIRLTRETVHKGDVVAFSSRPQDTATVVRVNPKTVSLDHRSYPRTLAYERIFSVECPHEGTTVRITAPRKPASRPAPEPIVAERPAERPEPIRIDSRFEYFPTPAAVVETMLDAAELEPGMTVLEPSAGAGAIASAANSAGCKVDCVELCGDLARVLRDGCYRQVICTDFLEYGPRDNPAGAEYYDRVLMNPPFSRGQDIRHVTQALRFLKKGGRLVAILPAGVTFRQDKATRAFREMVTASGGWIKELPEDAFKNCGISVRTVMAVVDIPADTVDLWE